MTGALDGQRHDALLLTVKAGQAAGQNAAVGADEALQQLDIFVINVLDPMFFQIGGLAGHSGPDTGCAVAAGALAGFLKCHKSVENLILSRFRRKPQNITDEIPNVKASTAQNSPFGGQLNTNKLVNTLEHVNKFSYI